MTTARSPRAKCSPSLKQLSPSPRHHRGSPHGMTVTKTRQSEAAVRRGVWPWLREGQVGGGTLRRAGRLPFRRLVWDRSGRRRNNPMRPPAMTLRATSATGTVNCPAGCPASASLRARGAKQRGASRRSRPAPVMNLATSVCARPSNTESRSESENTSAGSVMPAQASSIICLSVRAPLLTQFRTPALCCRSDCRRIRSRCRPRR